MNNRYIFDFRVSNDRRTVAVRLPMWSLSIAFLVFSFVAHAAKIDPARSKELLKTLNSTDASFYDKARACQQSGEFGTVELVPVLAKLLPDEKLSDYARSGLENIPGSESAAALRSALGSLKGGLLVGVINSLGVVRDEKAVPVLQKLVADSDKAVSKESIMSLGKIANSSAMKTLLQMLKSKSEEVRMNTASSCMVAAQTKMSCGKVGEARKLYEVVNSSDIPASYKTGAVLGMILSRKSEGTVYLVEQLLSSDAEVRKAARLATQEFSSSDLTGALCKVLNNGSPDKQILAQDTLQQTCYKSMTPGRRFQGWEGDTTNSFRMKTGGVIVAGDLNNPIPRNEFLATTREYTNFIMRAECKLVGVKCNGGIQFRTQRIPNHNEVKGYQADMSMGKNGGYWGKLYDESRTKKLLGKSLNRPEMIRKLKADDWNQYEIRCEGKRIQLFVNGVKTLDYIETNNSIPQFGIIAVQIHGGRPSQAWYRNIQIAELP